MENIDNLTYDLFAQTLNNLKHLQKTNRREYFNKFLNAGDYVRRVREAQIKQKNQISSPQNQISSPQNQISSPQDQISSPQDQTSHKQQQIQISRRQQQIQKVLIERQTNSPNVNYIKRYNNTQLVIEKNEIINPINCIIEYKNCIQLQNEYELITILNKKASSSKLYIDDIYTGNYSGAHIMYNNYNYLIIPKVNLKSSAIVRIYYSVKIVTMLIITSSGTCYHVKSNLPINAYS